MYPIFTRAQQLEDESKPAALCTVVETAGSTPRKPGSRMIVYPDGTIEGTIGGGALEKNVIEKALEVIHTGESRLVEITLRENEPHSIGGICGGEIKVFVEKLGATPRLLIIGAGHVGITLARMAQDLNVQITVYDDRPEQADPALFPPYSQALCGPFDQAMETLKPTAKDYIAIVTYKHIHDSEVLYYAVQTPAKYIGMIGSEQKCMRVMDDLKQRGIPQERLDRVHAPIGLAIGAHTPGEVAVSILAQIVQVMNGPA